MYSSWNYELALMLPLGTFPKKKKKRRFSSFIIINVITVIYLFSCVLD